jgi:hypothetical protein
MDLNEQREWGFYILELVSDFPYNPIHQIARVRYKGRSVDLRINSGTEVPNHQNHLVLAIVPERVMETAEVPEERLGLPPGLASGDGTIAAVPQGICFLIDKRQTVKTTNPQNGQASFSISNTNMFDLNNIMTAVSPAFIDRDYTTIDKNKADPNVGSVGMFINKQGTVLIKSTGGSITIGKEGVHIGGRLFQESSAIDTGALADNTFADLIPSTIVTFPVSFPKILNHGYLVNIANAGMKFIEITDKARAVSRFGSAIQRIV